MKKWIPCVALSALLALTAGSGQAFGENKKETAKASKKNLKAPNWMFVISSGTGMLSPGRGGSYTLKMNLPAINQALLFSDRPYRSVKVINAATLKLLWDRKDANSLSNDPPNAALTSTRFKPIIVKIEGVQIKNNIVYFTVKLNKGNSGSFPSKKIQLSKVVLTIDNFKLMNSVFVTSLATCVTDSNFNVETTCVACLNGKIHSKITNWSNPSKPVYVYSLVSNTGECWG